MGNHELLLSETQYIIDKYSQEFAETGEQFNVFNIMHLKETQMCRFLYELINPKGCHYHKAEYLKLFITLLKIDKKYTHEQLRKASVHRELVISDKKRVDLTIEINGDFYPIEVKIDAEDQEAQCYDYSIYRNTKVYYLTKNVRMPSDKSISSKDNKENKLDRDRIVHISWDKIGEWLDDCVTVTKSENIKLMLTQFRKSIDNMLGKAENRMNDDINKIIQDYPHAALEIYNNYRSSVEVLIKKIINGITDAIIIDNKIADENIERNTYRNGKYLGNTIKLKDGRFFRIEVEWNLYAGFIENNEFTNWFYLADKTSDKSNLESTPNFHDMSGNALALFDDKNREEFISKCIDICNEAIKYK